LKRKLLSTKEYNSKVPGFAYVLGLVTGPKLSNKVASAGIGIVSPELMRMKELTVSTEQVIGYDVPEYSILQVPTEASVTVTVEGYLILKAAVKGI
jgi:hypothetical protein